MPRRWRENSEQGTQKSQGTSCDLFSALCGVLRSLFVGTQDRSRPRDRSTSAGSVASQDAPAVAIRTAAGEPTTRAQRAVESILRGKFLAAPATPGDRARPAQPSASARSAASAASSPPRTANRSPSPVIGSTKPAASPASNSPSGSAAPVASTANGPMTVGVGDETRA